MSACSSQQAQSPPPKPAPPPLEFLGEWGVRGDGPGQLSSPSSLAVDSVGNVFTVDGSTKFVNKFNSQGHPLFSFQDTRFKDPSDIALDRGDSIYVTDYAQNTLFIFFSNGNRLREIRGGPGRHFDRPVAVTVDDDGNTYVLEQAGQRIQKFDARGRFTKAWGKNGEGTTGFESALDICIGKDGFLYVAGTDNHRVKKFTRDGEFVAEWELPLSATESGSVRFVSAIAASEKWVFLANSIRRTIDVWSVDGRHLLESNLGDKLPPGPPEIKGLAVSSRGELLILDPVTPRVLRFRVNF